MMATPGHANDFARAAFALLLGDAGLGLVDLARQLAVSPRTLQRRLASAGTTMQALVRSARVALAGDALVRNATGHVSLTTVALACGFADSAHLSREFRHLVAMQPSAFARSIAVPSRAKRRRLAR
ncbi:MAG: helix-turn-helix transcriptional regulator [Myxococcales bacterium]|nr:helix-turn-helix transcriptional regulator [Myxococcales bacterium]